MAKMKIKTRSWVHKGGELVPTDTLSPEERQELATWLCLTWFNTLYAGRAEFRRTCDVDSKETKDWEPAPVGLFPQKGDTKDDETVSVPPVCGGGDGGDPGRDIGT